MNRRSAIGSRKLTTPLAVAALSLALAACQHVTPGQQAGAVLGSVVGGVAGTKVGKGAGKTLAIGAGALLGLFAGAELGKSLDVPDRKMMDKTAQNTLENKRINQTGNWRNPDSGNAGTLTPQRTYKNAEGQFCRDFKQTVTIANRVEQAHGKACRRADGVWMIVTE